MASDLAEKLLKQPPTTAVDLVMVREGLKIGAEIIRGERNEDLEELMGDMDLRYQWVEDRYQVAQKEEDLKDIGTDSASRGLWFGIPECCIQNYQDYSKKELQEKLRVEEAQMLSRGESVPDEFYLGSTGYVPCSIKCKATLKRGKKARKALEEIDPRLWRKFRNLHIRRGLVEYGGEIEWWRKKEEKKG
ncbi:hypothetical protein AKJ45_03180 [candidate division MSBL1 archaeon SCGC-AAA261F19]|uniref:DUF483 domain-containing protein n=1 Tax=candidate division MSBL1 archaeon SCGC-AAA261F19 TaxID=1698275 RepID=A0A133V8Y3_9EURY|nr:hypothetical protein AKJ45_03180 [candidate division MSBL1 archaeon SCGC-AAA261F19]